MEAPNECTDKYTSRNQQINVESMINNKKKAEIIAQRPSPIPESMLRLNNERNRKNEIQRP
jgi:hypothetical protein